MAALMRRRSPRRTGALQRAIAVVRTTDGAGVTFPARYAIHDQGGVIRPTRGRWLAVPIAGTPRDLPPRMTGRHFVLRTRGGRLFLALPGGALNIRYRLVRSIRIRRSGFATSALLETADRTEHKLLALAGTL